MNNQICVRIMGAMLVVSTLSTFAEDAQKKDPKPNIVWIMAEDISTELACYGHPAVKTPILDSLALQGTRYTQAFCTAPSCTPSRNAMMTGIYQTRTDTQDQRRRGVALPEGMKPITHLLRDAGYYTALGCGYSDKTDLNFKAEPLFDGKDWSERKKGQPFFAQITLPISHRQGKEGWSRVRKASKFPVKLDEVELPPYFPDHPVCKQDWAEYLDSIEEVDSQVGAILARLKTDGIEDNTVVIFIGDNGRCHLRGKCWLYDPGILVPLIIRWPGKIRPETVNEDMISMIDISATILEIAGVELPSYLDGHPILGSRAKKRDHIFAARDLIDEVMDHIRCVRTKRFKYIRNYTPENGYRECEYVQRHRPMLPVIKELHAQGKLTVVQQLLLAKEKPREELYDLQTDPYEINNLAQSPKHQKTLKELGALLDAWIADTEDKGLAQIKTSNKTDAGADESAKANGAAEAAVVAGKAFIYKTSAGKERQMEIYFNEDPWRTLTLNAADRFLVKQGLLKGEPTVQPPATGEKLIPAPKNQE